MIRIGPDSRLHALLLYLGIGGVSVGVDVGTLVVLHSLLHLPLTVSTATAFLLSVVVNFVANRYVMSGGGGEDLTRHAFRYLTLLSANLVLTVLVVSGGAHLGIPYVVAKLAIVAASTAWNFVLYRRWVFAD